MTPHSSPSPSAKLFPRPQYEAALEKAIATLGVAPHNKLVFYGREGIGKTGLSKVMAASLRARQEYCCVVLNGEGMQRHKALTLEQGVRRLRNELVRGGINLRCFDLAYAYYWAKEYPHLAFDPTQFAQRMDEADTLSTGGDLISAVVADLQQTLPFVGTATKLAWFLIRFSEPLWQWYRQSGCDLAALEACTDSYEVLELLPRYLARNLNQELQQQSRQAVILIDGYEALLDESGCCFWLEELIRIPNPNLLWVLFSDRQLPEMAVEQQIAILPLTREESRNWLAASRVDNESVCQAIVEVAQGIPQYLEIAIATWRTIKKRRPPQVEEFAQNSQEIFAKAGQAWEPDEERVYQVLSIPRCWDQPLFECLMQQYGLEHWRDRLDVVTASPYVESSEPGVWHLHPSMRLHVQQQQPVDAQQAIHGWLVANYQTQYQGAIASTIAVQPLDALDAVLYHGLRSEKPAQTVDWVLEQVPMLQAQDRDRALVPILQGLVDGSINDDRLAAAPVQPYALTTEQQAIAWMRLGRSQRMLGQWDDALKTLEQAKAAWAGLQQDNSLNAAFVELELAYVYWRYGRKFDANNACLRAKRIWATLLGADSLEVADVINLQASIVASRGEQKEAIALNQQALDIVQRHPNAQPLRLAQLKLTAAQIRRDFNYKLDETPLLCQEALAIIQTHGQTHGGEEHPLAIVAHGLLGDVYQKIGTHKAQAAFEQYQQALAIAELRLGLSHRQTLQLLKALSKFCQKLGDPNFASQLSDRYETYVQLGNGVDSLEVAAQFNRLAMSLYKKGEYGKAEPHYVQALQIRQRLLGAEHPDVANSLNNLAVLYRAQGRYDAAEPLYVQALQMSQRLLGDEHPDVASSLNALAALYDAQGRYDAAEPLYVQALQISQRLLGDEHRTVANILNNLAELYRAQGRYDAAEPLLRQAWQMRQRLLGAEHPDVANSLNNLALLYYAQDRHDAAEPLLVQALQMRQRLLGGEHPDVVSSLNNLAGLYCVQGRYDVAEPLLVQTLQMSQQLLGAEHPDVANRLNSLAGLYHAQGRYDAAEPLLVQALQIRQRVLGNEHPDVAHSLNSLGALYFFQGRYDAAESLLVQALQMSQRLLGDEHPGTLLTKQNLENLRTEISSSA